MNSENLNIICLGGFTYPRGMAGTKRVQFFIDRFLEKEIPVRVITMGNFGDEKDGNKKNGVKGIVEYYNLGASLPKSLLSYFAFPFLILNGIIKLSSLKRKNFKNILFVYNSIGVDIFLIVLFAKLSGFKILIDIVENYRVIDDDLSFPLKIKYKSTIFFEKHIAFFCDAVVTLSSSLKKLFVQELKIKAPIHLIPVSSNLKAEIKNKTKFSKPLRISYTGSFAKKDGLTYLIEAFNTFSRIYPDSELLLTGAGKNPAKVALEANNEKIKYIGYLSDEEYNKFLIDADILCMTRVNSEFANAGFPFKLGEYLATGNPVITTSVSDVSLYLQNEVDAKIVEPENSDALVSALISYAGDFKAAREIGEHGREKSHQHFNYKTNGDMLINIMEKL